MPTETTLIQQAKSEKRKREIDELKGLYKNLSRSQIIKRLLPSYDIQPKPKLFFDSSLPDKYIIGGYGSGKTYSFCAEALFLNWVNRPYKILLITQTKGNTEVTTLDTLLRLLTENDIAYTRKDLPTYTRIAVHWGDKDGVFLLASGYSEYALKGPSMAAVGLDEAFIISKASRDVIITRARDTRAIINEVFFSGTPEPLKMDWGHDVIENDYLGDEKTFKITMSLDDNKFASQENKDRIKRMYDEQMQEVYYHGRYHSLTGDVVYRFIAEKNKRPYSDLPYLPQLPGTIELGIGFDFNVDPITAGLIWVDKGVAKQIDEYQINNSNTEELCELIGHRLQENFPGITEDNRLRYSIIIGMDAAARQRKTSAKIGITDAKIIQRYFQTNNYNCTIRIPNENPPVRDRINYVNNLFDKEAFLIYDNCKHSILDRRLTQWKGNYEGFKIKKTGGRSHMSEAVDYILWILQKILKYEFNSNLPQVSVSSRRRRR